MTRPKPPSTPPSFATPSKKRRRETSLSPSPLAQPIFPSEPHSTPINNRATTPYAATSNHYVYEEAYARAAREMESKFSKISVEAFLNLLPETKAVMPAVQYDALAKIANLTDERKMYNPFIQAMQPYLAREWRLVNTSNHSETSPAAQFFSGTAIKPDMALYRQFSPGTKKRTNASRAELFGEFKVREIDDPFPDPKGTRGESGTVDESRTVDEARTVDESGTGGESGTGEVKDDDGEPFADPKQTGGQSATARDTRGQITLYINAIQSIQHRTRVFFFFILRDRCRLFCHSRAGTQYTDLFKHTEQPYLHEFFWRLSAAKAREKLPNGMTCSQLYRVKVGTKTLFINEPFTTQHLYPVGRATRCYSAYDPESDGLVLLKDCWRNSKYEAEHLIYNKLHAAHVTHIPHALAGADVQGFLQSTELEPNGHQLIHYRLVLDIVGMPITESTSTFAFTEAIRDALIAHREAYDNANLLHRDISIGNIVIWQGQGYLIDWEQAKDINDNSARTNSRTGTWQFLSVRLLSQPNHIHEIRDDLESFVYVMVHTAVRFAANDLTPEKRMFLLQQFNHNEDSATFGREVIVGKGGALFDLTTTSFGALLDELTTAVRTLYAKESEIEALVKFDLLQDPASLVQLKDVSALEQLLRCRVPERRARLLSHDWITKVFEHALKAPGWAEGDWMVQPVADPHSKNSTAFRRFKMQEEYEGQVSSYRTPE
ncbi:hypothetical protein D9757_012013 [Collybiopsis confluens]|uniref:Protein kinase domain-containing protein n=1 Tax=Collybiopsis confluens TaxID=2823264 RepID=A0A8H5GS67_9AGAR|nr:hypothetical protein D9757_012013 [Collybiopsis confluens]